MFCLLGGTWGRKESQESVQEAPRSTEKQPKSAPKTLAIPSSNKAGSPPIPPAWSASAAAPPGEPREHPRGAQKHPVAAQERPKTVAEMARCYEESFCVSQSNLLTQKYTNNILSLLLLLESFLVSVHEKPRSLRFGVAACEHRFVPPRPQSEA